MTTIADPFKPYTPVVASTQDSFTSQDTAYVVNDYPYGFRLRCNIRYWVEFGGDKKGYRLCSQTSNPKNDNLTWNKPKASTYSLVAMVLAQNEEGHIVNASLNEYSSCEEALSFVKHLRTGMNEQVCARVVDWAKKKSAFHSLRAKGVIKMTMNGQVVPDTNGEIERNFWEAAAWKEVARLLTEGV